MNGWAQPWGSSFRWQSSMNFINSINYDYYNMSEFSQLIVSLNINSKNQQEIHFPSLSPRAIDKTLTQFITKAKIKKQALPYIKEKINIHIQKYQKLNTHHKKQQKISMSPLSNRQLNSNSSVSRSPLSKKQQGAYSQRIPTKQAQENVWMRQFKVTDLEKEMQEQMRIIKLQKKVEKLQPQLSILFHTLTKGSNQKHLLDSRKIKYEGVKRQLMLELGQMFEKCPKKQLTYEDFKEAITKWNGHKILQNLQ